MATSLTLWSQDKEFQSKDIVSFLQLGRRTQQAELDASENDLQDHIWQQFKLSMSDHRKKCFSKNSSTAISQSHKKKENWVEKAFSTQVMLSKILFWAKIFFLKSMDFPWWPSS